MTALYVYQLIGVFCDRLKFGSTAVKNYQFFGCGAFGSTCARGFPHYVK